MKPAPAKTVAKKPVPPAKKKKLSVDFTNVETRVLTPEGECHARVKSIEEEEGNEYPYLHWTFSAIAPGEEHDENDIHTNTSLAPAALWNLRSLLDNLGVDTPDGEFDLDLESYLGMEINLTIEHETYDGRKRARVTDYSRVGETAEVEDDGTEPDAEVEEEEVASEDEVAEDEVAEEEVVEEEVEEEPVAPVAKKAAPVAPVAKKGAPAPAPAAKVKTKKYAEGEVAEMDEDELKALCRKLGLKVKLDGLRPTKQQAMVVDALEAAGLLAE